jgi:hypothetical protein
MPHKVIGFVENQIEFFHSLDGEIVTPLKFDVLMDPNPWNMHVQADYCLLLPYDEVIDLGGEAASLSIRIYDSEKVDEISKKILKAFPTMFIFTSVDDKVTASGQGESLVLWGWQNQMIVMVINFLAILNIILGSVYERKKDISTYSIVGLSPIHISFMFLAEASVYSLLGGITGFITAMIMGKASALFLPEALILNYSSSWVLIALGVAALATFISSIYPMWIAARLATPSLERTWKIPTKPFGDVWEIPLPVYIAGEKDTRAFIQFVEEFMSAHGNRDAPNFYITTLERSENVKSEEAYIQLVAKGTHIFPFDVGVEQDFTFRVSRREEEKWQITMLVKRTLGDLTQWEALNHMFLDVMRKQALLWTSMGKDEKQRYLGKQKE